jgi:hypothetical protein
MTDTPTLLRLKRCTASDPGHALGLRRGDELVAIDGRAPPASLRVTSDSRQRHVLTIRRDEAVWPLLSDRLDLGQWERFAATEAPPKPEWNADTLCNWEIIVHPNGRHDLFAASPSWLALLVPGLWLAQQRMWTWLATLAAALAVALPAGWLVMVAIWVLAGMHMWRSGVDHLRADRAQHGWRRVGVMAARSEQEAVALWKSVHPDASFVFDGPVAAVQPAAA